MTQKWAEHIFSGKGVIMQTKVTWKDIYNDFCSIYPNLRKRAIGYTPYGYMRIMIYCKDGERMVFDGIEQRLKLVC